MMDLVWRFAPCTGSELIILLALADNADDNGISYPPSIPELGTKARLLQRQVQRIIRKLQKTDLVHIEDGKGVNGSHKYQLLFENFEGASSTTPGRLLAHPPRAHIDDRDVHTGSEQGSSLRSLTDKEHNTKTLMSSSKTNLTERVNRIFEYWQQVMNKPRTSLDSKRRTKITGRCKDYTDEQLFHAIDGCKLSPHNMGENDNNTKYNDIELICRDNPHVDRFIGIYESKGKNKGPTDVRKKRSEAAEKRWKSGTREQAE
jgi:hypothetical protein